MNVKITAAVLAAVIAFMAAAVCMSDTAAADGERQPLPPIPTDMAVYTFSDIDSAEDAGMGGFYDGLGDGEIYMVPISVSYNQPLVILFDEDTTITDVHLMSGAGTYSPGTGYTWDAPPTELMTAWYYEEYGALFVYFYAYNMNFPHASPAYALNFTIWTSGSSEEITMATVTSGFSHGYIHLDEFSLISSYLVSSLDIVSISYNIDATASADFEGFEGAYGDISYFVPQIPGVYTMVLDYSESSTPEIGELTFTFTVVDGIPSILNPFTQGGEGGGETPAEDGPWWKASVLIYTIEMPLWALILGLLVVGLGIGASIARRKKK